MPIPSRPRRRLRATAHPALAAGVLALTAACTGADSGDATTGTTTTAPPSMTTTSAAASTPSVPTSGTPSSTTPSTAPSTASDSPTFTPQSGAPSRAELRNRAGQRVVFTERVARVLGPAAITVGDIGEPPVLVLLGPPRTLSAGDRVRVDGQVLIYNVEGVPDFLNDPLREQLRDFDGQPVVTQATVQSLPS